MKDSKIIFGIVAAVLVIACVLIYVFLVPDDPSAQWDGVHSQNSEQQKDAAENETYPPLETNVTVPEETAPIITQENNVVINKVAKDPNEVIDRTASVDESHPEYCGGSGGDMYFSAEGKVYRNDKTITFRMNDRHLNKYHEITFGYITGGCNRFLYLNPVLKTDGEQVNAYFHFLQPIGGGSVFSINKRSKEGPSYIFGRTLDEKMSAGYVGPKQPGAIWFAQNKCEGPVFIDTIVMAANGDYIASLRIWITKDPEDGTFSISDIDDNNVVNTRSASDAEFTDEELQRILDLAVATMNDSESMHLSIKFSKEKEYDLDDIIIDWRDLYEGLYFMDFVPKEGIVERTKLYADGGMPILAVTLRDYYNDMSLTLYFFVYHRPYEDSPGTYQFIGRDYHNYSTQEAYQKLRAPGPLEE